MLLQVEVEEQGQEGTTLETLLLICIPYNKDLTTHY
jgi:hypothetical protein